MLNHELYNSVRHDQEKLYAANPSRMVGNNHLSSHYQTDFQQQQMKEEEERSKIEKGKEGATVDLMQVLLASTKEVKEQNDGFVDVVKKTKGNNGIFFQKKLQGGKQISSQGHQGNFLKNEGSGVFAGNRKQGQKGNYPKIGNSRASVGIRYQGYNGNNQENLEFSFDRGGKTGGKNGQGYYGNIQLMKGTSNDSKIEQGQSWKSNKVMGKNKDGGDVSEVKGFVGNNSRSRSDQEAKKSEARVNFNGSRQGYIPKSGARFQNRYYGLLLKSISLILYKKGTDDLILYKNSRTDTYLSL
ncbi:unnamed protein product [Lactuca saligna]|uniref:Uncharacterized protein n=1 Tax=Lactuca saligna TaxID=75948 RepID=A0AA36EHE2_LACSI|nr:unnamed protein product [Lactuca saligna]